MFHLQYPHRIQFDSWQDEDGPAHAFMLFNVKPQVARQFPGKDEKKAIELWDAVQQRYHRANKAQMMALENQLANTQVSHEEVNHKFCLPPKAACFPRKKGHRREFAYCLMTKILESFETLWDTISLLPMTPSLNTFVGIITR